MFLDLAEILSDNIADTKMSRITWIIIVLIVISIAVTVTEVILRFALLSKGKAERNIIGDLGSFSSRNFTSMDFTSHQLEAICGVPAQFNGRTLSGL